MNIANSTTLCQAILQEKSYRNTAVIRILVEFNLRYAHLQVSHEYIAKLAKCSVSTVKRCINKYVSLGLLSSTYLHMRSSVYKISPIFKQYAHLLMDKVPYLQKIALPQSCFDWFGVSNKLKNFFSNQNELHITKGYVLNPVSIYTRERYIPEETYIPKNGVILNKIFPRRRSMIEFIPCPELKELTKMLNLTKWGQIRMSPFAGVIINQAMRSFKNLHKTPNDPFSWIFMGCKTLSETAGISIDWDKFYALKEQHGMKDDAEMILPKVVKTSVNPEVYRTRTPAEQQRMEKIMESVRNDPKKSATQQGFAAMFV